MTDPVLSIVGVGKAYRRYRSEGRRVLAMLGLPVVPLEENWVLRGVSFQVHPGEAVGIVGQNGAGTLARMSLLLCPVADEATAFSGQMHR